MFWKNIYIIKYKKKNIINNNIFYKYNLKKQRYEN